MRRLALRVLFASIVAIAAAYASAFLPGGAPRAAAFVFAIATSVMTIAVLVLGASRHNRDLGILRWVFALCFLILAGGFCLALMAPPVSADSELWLGLPQGAAIILYAVGMLPIIILPLAYALTFDNTTLSEDELADVRQRLAELRERP